jgi:prepilin-type processing-associated H-X9-DG protein
MNQKAGFTRIDLAFISGTLGIFLLLGASTLATTSSQTQGASCINNHQTLITAWTHHAADNNGLMTGPVHGGLSQNPTPSDSPGSTSPRPWAVGWIDWSVNAANTNYAYMTDPAYASLALYVNRRKEIFQCPSDTYVSAAQTSRGWTRRARSYSSSIALGDGNGGPGDGPWDIRYIKARRLSQLVNPSPSLVYVFIDENPDSNNDVAFINPYFSSQVSWVDLPGNLHSGAATLSFADGHVGQKLWTGGLASLPVKFNFSAPPSSPADRNDIQYLAARAPKVP